VSEAFAVDFSDQAKQDIGRLFEFLLLRATTPDEFERVQETIDELRLAIELQLARAPFNYRTAGSDPLRRELVVPVGATGHVALYDILPPSLVLVLAVRHQLEDDYH